MFSDEVVLVRLLKNLHVQEQVPEKQDHITPFSKSSGKEEFKSL